MTYDQFCDSPQYKNLSSKQKTRFTELSTALLKSGFSEVKANEVALLQSKKVLTQKSKTLPTINPLNEEEMVAVEVVYEPNVPDSDGQWMSPETVRKACADFNDKLSTGEVKPNLFHSLNTESFEIQKSWINEVDCVIGDQLVPEGTWICSLKYKSQKLWEMKKAGEVGPVSIGANGAVLKKIDDGDSIEEV